VPEVSLVVSTLGRTREIERLLASLRAQTFKDFEVIVVNQNSDGRLDCVLSQHRSSLNLLEAKSARGLSLGRNTGIALVSGNIVAFPDDDCWYPPDLLNRVVATFHADQRLDLLSGRTADRENIPSLGVFHPTRRRIERGNVWRAGNSNTIFAKTSDERPLHFDETLGVGAKSKFQSGEETDLLLRLLSQGARMLFDPDFVIHHDQVDVRDPDAGLRRAHAYAPGQGRVLRLSRYNHVQVLWFTARPLVRAGLAFLTGDIPLARYKMAWVSGVLAGYFAKPRGAMRPLQK
jgi:glycosyltransferase involved in cell wall biosynthesis